MVTKQYAELHPEEYLGRDIFTTSEGDIQINSKDDLTQIRYDECLKQAIINRLKTAIGELTLYPDYGSRLYELIGTQPSELSLSVARMHVKESLLQEPRILEILNITPTFRAGTQDTVIDIDISVSAIRTETVLNLVYSLFV